MRRFGFVRSSALGLLTLTTIYAVSAACSFDINDPCYSRPEDIQLRGQLDGIWVARTIDGRPADGFQLPNVNPFATPVFFVNGSIDFKTREVQGKCDTLEKSSGYAVANYLLRKNGALQPNKRYVARFEYDHATNTVTLSAAGYTVKGDVSGNGMAIVAPHPIFGNYTLVLTR